MDDHRIAIPRPLVARFRGWHSEVAWDYNPQVTTYRLTSPEGEVQYLKVATHSWWPSLGQECERMRWAIEFLPVPEVVEHHHDETVQWLIAMGLPGRSGVDPALLAQPRDLAVRLANALRVFHAAPVSACPFDFRLDAAVAHARDRVSRDEVDPARDFHDEYKHLTATEALGRLENTRPPTEDLVVCHGDYCPPNILFTQNALAGFVDLAELGVADRWWDLAVATWSVGWNLGKQYEPLFLEVYGVEPDDARCAYYRLLYDVAS